MATSEPEEPAIGMCPACAGSRTRVKTWPMHGPRFVTCGVCARSREINLTQAEWDALDEDQRDFVEEAAWGGLRYRVHDGVPQAWGARTKGIFSMAVLRISKYDAEEIVVTPIKRY